MAPPEKVEPVEEEEKKAESPEKVEVEKTPEQLTEIIGKPSMSQAELKKLAELKRLKREAKKKATQEKPVDDTPKAPPVSLPPVMANRRGQFELIPDFLKQNEVKKDLFMVEEKDMLDEALRKQDK